MILLKSAKELAEFIQQARSNKRSIGFVPTMGALHKGHLSLIDRSRLQTGLTVCSIFVNPTQFNNPEDFKKYPVTIETDIDMLEEHGCDLLFLPRVDEIYIPGTETIHYDLGYLETVLEAAYRPGHFQGVCQVVDRLLQIVDPDILYLGQKDLQQCMVIKKLTELKRFQTNLIICPTLREVDGLAMSSRNKRLNEVERNTAVLIYETLLKIKHALRTGSLQELKQNAINNLTGEGFKVDYVEIADADTLELQTEWDGKKNIVALIAAYINDVRLIDNMLLN
ncbi:MAG: pantoate--beta-alanine ligase, partial [Ferruginibacter sp.]